MEEEILDFIYWFVENSTDIFELIDHPEDVVKEYLEQLYNE